MLTQAILIGLVAMCVTFEWALGTCLASRPIVTGVLIGLVMGDLQTGIIVGATLEMVFIGSVTILGIAIIGLCLAVILVAVQPNFIAQTPQLSSEGSFDDDDF